MDLLEAAAAAQTLVFDADFESGNLCEVSDFRDGEYDVAIRGNSGNARHSIWFYFRVRGVAGQRLVCHVSQYSKAKSLLVFSEGAVRGFKCNRHRRNCVTFATVFARGGDEHFFAFTDSYLQKLLADVERL